MGEVTKDWLTRVREQHERETPLMYALVMRYLGMADPQWVKGQVAPPQPFRPSEAPCRGA